MYRPSAPCEARVPDSEADGVHGHRARGESERGLVYNDWG